MKKYKVSIYGYGAEVTIGSVNEEQKTPINHNKRFFESYQSISAKKFLQMSGEIKT